MSDNPETHVPDTSPKEQSEASAAQPENTPEEPTQDSEPSLDQDAPTTESSNEPIDTPPLEHILEAALMAFGNPLSLERMKELFDEDDQPSTSELKQAIGDLQAHLNSRGIEVVEVASGYRLQVRPRLAPWVAKLWDERPQRYSRALLETLSLIAYRQPITRGDIEDVRGVTVSSSIIKTLLDRDWVRVVGHRDVPGRPAMYATTKAFLDYFNLSSLEELPSLMAIRELDDTNRKLQLGDNANVKQETPSSYAFKSDEEVAERGEEVLKETEQDLQAAKAIADGVEERLAQLNADDQGDELGDGDDSDTTAESAEQNDQEDGAQRLSPQESQTTDARHDIKDSAEHALSTRQLADRFQQQDDAPQESRSQAPTTQANNTQAPITQDRVDD